MPAQRLDMVGQSRHLGHDLGLGAAKIDQQASFRQERTELGQLPQNDSYRRRQDDYVRIAHTLGQIGRAIPTTFDARIARADQDSEGQLERVGIQIEIHWERAVLPGYGWIFALGSGWVNVGIGCRTQDLGRLPTTLRGMLGVFVENNPHARERLKHATRVGPIVGHPLRANAGSVTPLADHVLVAGEAAGLVNPLTGDTRAFVDGSELTSTGGGSRTCRWVTSQPATAMATTPRAAQTKRRRGRGASLPRRRGPRPHGAGRSRRR